MFPAAVLAGLMVAILKNGPVARSALTVLLATHLSYLVAGRLDQTFNIAASNQARDLGNAVSHLTLPGHRGVIFGIPEPDVSWIVRGVNFGPLWSIPPGELFAKANRLQLRLVPASAAVIAVDPDLGLARQNQGTPFRLVSRTQTLALLNPELVPPKAGTMLGGRGSWERWKWSERPSFASGSVVLRSGFNGFIGLDARRLDGRLLVYRAEGLDGASVPMRLQVNWTKQDGSLLSATIQVVHVRRHAQNYLLAITAPPGAEVANVYVSLHDGASGSVLVHSVRLLE